MAIFHLSTKPISRSAGRSAVAAAAYRTKSVLLDERQGLLHDYTKRTGVPFEKLVLPEGADEAHWTRERLWNAAEFAEVRKDARTAREWEIALPEELSANDRKELALGFARELAQRYGCAVDVGIHTPGKGGDRRNHHAHLLATTRVVMGIALGEKTAIELSDAKRLSLGLGQGRQEIEQVRALWAERTNQALVKQGQEARIDHRSLAVQHGVALTAGDVIRAAALDRMPEPKLGWKASAIERRGEKTERGNQLREVRRENALRKVLSQKVARIEELSRKVGQYLSQGAQQIRKRFVRTPQQLVTGDRLERREESTPNDLRRTQAGAERERARQLQQAKELARQEAKAEAVRARAQVLWEQTPSGVAERTVAKRCEDDRERTVEYRANIDRIEKELAQWKKSHRLLSIVAENVALKTQLQDAIQQAADHESHSQRAVGELEELAARKAVAWPALERQAVEDVKPIAVRLTPNQAWMLLQDSLEIKGRAAAETFEELQKGSAPVSLGNRLMKLQYRENEGFVCLLRQMTKPSLDQRLADLQRQQHRAQVRARQAEIERKRPNRELERD